MAKAFVFYNPLAGQGKILEDLEALEFVLDVECVFCDMTKPETYGEALFDMAPNDALVICGGDGTLNRFVNLVEDIHLPNEIYYYPAGEHNDFARDFGCCYGSNPFSVSKALKRLPQVQTGNKIICFLTGVLFLAERRIRCFSGKKQRYTDKNTPQRVRVSVDRALHAYENVRFAAVMQGKHCNGGMIADVKRLRTDEDLSCVLIHGCSRLTGNYLLRQLQKGRTPQSRHLTIHRGREIRLTFEEPVCLLVDGEVHTGAAEFTARGKETT